MGSEVTNNKKKKGEITDVISKWIPLLTGIITLVVAIGNFALNFLNYGYARKAEEFYGVPSRYFTNSFVDDKVMIFVSIFLYFVILDLPFILKKLYKVEKLGKFESVLYSLVIFVDTIPVVYMSIIEIIVFFNLSVSELPVIIATVIIAMIIAITTFVFYMSLFTKDISNVRKEDLGKLEIKEEKVEGRNDKNTKKTKKSKTKEVVASNNQEKAGALMRFKGFIKELPTIILAAVLTFVVLSPFIITADRIIEKPQNKTKYEIVTINDGDKENEHYMAVVSYKNGKAALMYCKMTQEANKDGENGNIDILQLAKGSYRLIDIAGYQIEYKEFNVVKCEEEN